ncbi:MAG: type II toxin-antitoxin system HicB family antitoxin [Candidatus Heimdallarchaeota archaeon]|nr:type II toxin-antitoxin system HicB family antitoxin [Candidatus Heimdallarchaeota archaeon]
MSNESKYPIEIHWSEEDKCYIASAPDLKGCTAHGYTREDALAEIQTAIELWLETAIEDGEQIPIPGKKQIIA